MSSLEIGKLRTRKEERLDQGRTEWRGEPGFGPRQPDPGAHVLKSDDVLPVGGLPG